MPLRNKFKEMGIGMGDGIQPHPRGGEGGTLLVNSSYTTTARTHGSLSQNAESTSVQEEWSRMHVILCLYLSQSRPRNFASLYMTGGKLHIIAHVL